MFEKQCNLTRAARYYFGGSGGSDIDVPSFSETQGDVLRGFKSSARQYRSFANQEPLLSEQMPILQELGRYGQEAANQFYGEPANLLQDAGQLRAGAGRLQSQFADVPGQILQDASGLRTVLGGQLPIAQTGELTQDQRNQAIQTARAGAQDRGDTFSNPAVFAEAMNRRQYADARQQQAIANIQSLGQTAAGLDTGAFGIASGREGAAASLLQGAGQLTQGAQGIAQGNEQLLGYPSEQLTRGELGRVGAYSTLVNPLYGLAGQRLQAQAAANTAAAGNQQSNKNSTIGTIGTIAGAALTAY